MTTYDARQLSIAKTGRGLASIVSLGLTAYIWGAYSPLSAILFLFFGSMAIDFVAKWIFFALVLSVVKPAQQE